jgi:predicted nicotinamide N-methyase
VEVAGRSLRAVDLDDARVLRRITEEVRAGLPVYYDRRWRLTEAFCRFLLERPGLVEGRRVLVAGAGVGLEAVVVGLLAGRVVVNERSFAALELAAEQLRLNGVEEFTVAPGSFAEVELEEIDAVVACFVVYDEETRAAVARLLDRASERGIPALLANEEIGGHFEALLEAAPGPVEELALLGRGRVVRAG